MDGLGLDCRTKLAALRKVVLGVKCNAPLGLTGGNGMGFENSLSGLGG